MKERSEFPIEIDDQGRGILPPEMVSRYGLKPGTKLSLEDGGNGFGLAKGLSGPAKIYIEPTNRCKIGRASCRERVSSQV
jgi:bifunctional DNA-binding transcriptional regulator/antitoxin component of YhaV-PrlF toxin-antitoxin module